MKKRLDVSQSVMEKITRFEGERSGWWLLRFRIVVGAFLALATLVLWHVVKQLKENNSLDLLTLFWEDAEIIQEFWQDTMAIFFEELPRETVVVAICILLGVVILVWLTGNKRKIIKRRLRILAKNTKT